MLRVLILLLSLLVFSDADASRYNGAAWDATACNYYNGAAWVACTGNRYSGAAWVALGSPVVLTYAELATNMGAVWVHADSVAGTTWSDESGNAHHGTMVNSPTWSATGGPGTGLPGYMSFVAADSEYVSIADHANLRFDDEFTVVMWVYNFTQSVQWASLFAKGNSAYQVRNSTSATDHIYNFDTRDSLGEGDFCTFDGTATGDFDATDAWTFLVFQRTATDLYIKVIHYVLTVPTVVQVATATLTKTLNTDTQLLTYAAQNNTGSNIRRYATVQMAGIAGFNKTLTNTQLIELFEVTFE